MVEPAVPCAGVAVPRSTRAAPHPRPQRRRLGCVDGTRARILQHRRRWQERRRAAARAGARAGGGARFVEPSLVGRIRRAVSACWGLAGPCPDAEAEAWLPFRRTGESDKARPTFRSALGVGGLPSASSPRPPKWRSCPSRRGARTWS